MQRPRTSKTSARTERPRAARVSGHHQGRLHHLRLPCSSEFLDLSIKNHRYVSCLIERQCLCVFNILFPAARSRRPPGLLHNGLSWTQSASETRLYSGGSSLDAKKELVGKISFYTKNAKPTCNGCHRAPQPPPSWPPPNKLLLQPRLLLRRQGDNSLPIQIYMVHIFLYTDMVHHTHISLPDICIPYSSYLRSLADIMVARCTEEKDKKPQDPQMFKVHKCSFSKIYLSKCPQNCFGLK